MDSVVPFSIAGSLKISAYSCGYPYCQIYPLFFFICKLVYINCFLSYQNLVKYPHCLLRNLLIKVSTIFTMGLMFKVLKHFLFICWLRTQTEWQKFVSNDYALVKMCRDVSFDTVASHRDCKVVLQVFFTASFMSRLTEHNTNY